MTKTIDKLDPMNQARKRLILDHEWWGSLSLRLQIVPDENVRTAETDGVSLWYNPKWFEALSRSEQDAVCAHEIEHCALGHIFRIEGRDLDVANEAADHVVNLDLLAAGFELPQPCFMDARFDGMSFEKVYSILKTERERKSAEPEPQDGQKDPGAQAASDDSASDPGEATGDGNESGSGPSSESENDENGTPTNSDEGPTENDGETTPGEDTAGQAESNAMGNVAGNSDEKPGDPRNFGGIRPAPDTVPETEDDLEHEWQTATEIASMVASKAGHMPASLRATLVESKLRREDLTAVLQEFLIHKTEYSYATPDKRMFAHGYVLPGVMRSNLKDVVIAIDTSGSVSDALLGFFKEKVVEVLSMDSPPERITVIYCDAVVQKVDEIEVGEVEFKFEAGGRGGTAFRPVFEYVEEHDIQPDVLIYLTDLFGDQPDEPEYPVLWVAPIESESSNWTSVKWGRQIFVDPYNN